MAKITAHKRRLREAQHIRLRLGGKSIATLVRVFPGLRIQAATPLLEAICGLDSDVCAAISKPGTFLCAACPTEGADHILCLSVHPCLWNNPVIARRAHAQRRIWLKQPPIKICNGRVSRAYGRMVDENGVEEVRMMVVPPGQTPWEAWNRYVEKMYALVLLPAEREGRASRALWEEDRVRRGRWLDEL
ncbi:hypothetical protein LTR95_017581 [Oleoguttula sp. CCFEE 5521]